MMASVLVITILACEARDAPELPDLRLSLDTIATIGELDAESGVAFGRIRAVRPKGESSLLVVDGISRHVYWVGLDGRPLGSIEASGAGPGDLRDPVVAEPTPGGEILVVDRGLGRLSWFVAEEDGFRSLRSARLEGRISHACELRGRLFLGGVVGGSTLHESDEHGSFSRSVGTLPQPEGIDATGPLRSILEQGLGPDHLLCLAEPGALITFQDHAPQLTARNLEGELLWERTFEWMVPERLEGEGGDRGGSFSWVRDPERGAHHASALLPWDAEQVLVQVEHVPPRAAAGSEHGLVSLLVGIEDGDVTATLVDFPRVRASDGNRFFTVEEDPFPRILVLERRANAERDR